MAKEFFIGIQFFSSIMPGTSLGHGFTAAIDKVMAFLWSLWLVVGPSIATMESFLEDVRSFTTDFGIESLMADFPNVLSSFAARVHQRVSRRFGAYKKLFPFCVYLPDWNHTCMNMVKRVLNELERWPKILAQLRILCQFFRVWEYRSCMRSALLQAGHILVAASLENFTAHLAHWRYETVNLVFCALHKLRHFCEHLFDRQILGNVEDKTLVAKAEEACRDPSLWRFPCTRSIT